MKIRVKLHPNSSQEKIEKRNEKEYEVWTRKKPINGMANIELIQILKRYFRKPVRIISGFGSRNKIIEIEDF